LLRNLKRKKVIRDIKAMWERKVDDTMSGFDPLAGFGISDLNV
jgi:hypothetical protein